MSTSSDSYTSAIVIWCLAAMVNLPWRQREGDFRKRTVSWISHSLSIKLFYRNIHMLCGFHTVCALDTDSGPHLWFFFFFQKGGGMPCCLLWSVLLNCSLGVPAIVGGFLDSCLKISLMMTHSTAIEQPGWTLYELWFWLLQKHLTMSV